MLGRSHVAPSGRRLAAVTRCESHVPIPCGESLLPAVPARLPSRVHPDTVPRWSLERVPRVFGVAARFGLLQKPRRVYEPQPAGPGWRRGGAALLLGALAYRRYVPTSGSSQLRLLLFWAPVRLSTFKMCLSTGMHLRTSLFWVIVLAWYCYVSLTMFPTHLRVRSQAVPHLRQVTATS